MKIAITFTDQNHQVQKYIVDNVINHPTKDIKSSNMNKKYRKKPVIIEAIQWNGENLSKIDEFTRGKVKNHESVLIIPTL